MNRNPEFSVKGYFYPGLAVALGLATAPRNAIPESMAKRAPLPPAQEHDGIALTNLFAGQLEQSVIDFEEYLNTVVGNV
jgi:hypothetical protein